MAKKNIEAFQTDNLKSKQIKINTENGNVKVTNGLPSKTEGLYRHKKNIYDAIRSENPYLN